MSDTEKVTEISEKPKIFDQKLKGQILTKIKMYSNQLFAPITGDYSFTLNQDSWEMVYKYCRDDIKTDLIKSRKQLFDKFHSWKKAYLGKVDRWNTTGSKGPKKKKLTENDCLIQNIIDAEKTLQINEVG